MLNTMIGMTMLGLFVQALIGMGFLVSSLFERERRASIAGLVQFLLMAGAFIVYAYLTWSDFLHTTPGSVIATGVFLLGVLMIGVMIKRDPPNKRAVAGSKGYASGQIHRFDERDHVFARNRSVVPETEQYRTYYASHPEYETYDAQRRSKGGPTGPMGKIDYPQSGFEVAMAAACLSIPQHLSQPGMYHPEQHPAAKQFVFFEKEFSPGQATQRIKGFTRQLGADLVGIAKLDPDWVYSRRGEIFDQSWRDWGQPIELTHQYAIVFAEEMDIHMTQTAPHMPTLVESMRNYAKGAFISTQLAAFIANLGYSATANHLRHYDLILPPVAVDAGLGEISRMGYLMTKEFGPRIRLGAVTTDMPLIPDKPVDLGIQSFCRLCRKCAVCCPSQSIPKDDEYTEVNGTLRWKLNAEGCFDYWAKAGTDCNVCMRVCPWSHERTWPHQLIVWLTQRNRINQRIFTLLDDVFYGHKPKSKTHLPLQIYN